MANEEQLTILRQGVEVWNKWREENPKVLIDLRKAKLQELDLSNINFSGAFLDLADLSVSKFRNANISNANLIGATLSMADFSNADLSKSRLNDASLIASCLIGANLKETQLTNANLMDADISNANLEKAKLIGTYLVRTKIDGADLSGSWVYAINAWGVIGESRRQMDLVITPFGEPVITVDNIEVAQFVYLLLNNQKIRNVIDTVTTKTVLILGRFTEERKQILDALRDALRERGLIPILFDFQPSPQRDLTETIQLLANMAKFIIADITEAKSIPQELSHIIPFLPSVPVQPILLVSSQEYGMFEHWRGFNSVLPEFLYEDEQHLIDNLEAKLILPINAWHKGQNKVSILETKIKELEEKLSHNDRS